MGSLLAVISLTPTDLVFSIEMIDCERRTKDIEKDYVRDIKSEPFGLVSD